MSIRQDLELDISAALAEVETLRSALLDAFTGAGDQLGLTVATAVDGLADVSPVITPTVDTSDAVSTLVADVESVTPIVPVEVTAEVDTLQAEVFNALDAIEPIVTPTADATAVLDEVASALDVAAQTPIDTQPISDQISESVKQGVEDGLSTSGDSAGSLSSIGDIASGVGDKVTGAFGQGGAAVSAFDFALAGAAGNLGDTASKIGALGPTAAVIGSITAATAGLFSQAEEVRAAEERLNIVFGDQAEAIQKVNIGGLVGDLGELTIQAGGNDEAMRQAVASLGQFGQGAGASQEQIAGAANQIAGLTLRAVTMNPSLGDAGAALNRLSGALLTGRAKALAPFGISLNQAEVKARAMQIALADGRQEATKFDTVTASAALATERLGDKMGKDFADGAAQSTVKLKSLRQQVGEFLEAAGAPILDPLIHSAEALVPVAGSLATTVGTVVQAVVPLATEVADDLAPALVDASDAIGQVVSAAAPAVQILGVGLGGAVRALAEVVGVVASAVDAIPTPLLSAGIAAGTMALAVGKLVPLLASGVAEVGLYIAAHLEGIPILGAFGNAALVAGAEAEAGLAAATGGLSLIVAGLAAAFIGFGLFGDAEEKASVDSKALGEVLFGLGTAADGTSAKILNLGDNFTKALDSDKLGDFGKNLTDNNNDLLNSFADVGVGVDQLAEFLHEGEDGLDGFTSAFQKAKGPSEEVRRALTSAGISTKELAEAAQAGGDRLYYLVQRVKNATATNYQAQRSTLEYIDTLHDQSSAFAEAQKAAQDYALGELRKRKSSEDLTDAELKKLDAVNRSKEGSRDYVVVLKEVEEREAKEAETAQRAADARSRQKADWASLATTVLSTSGDMSAAIDEFATKSNLSADEVKAFADQVSQALDGLVSDAAGTLPESGDAIKSWADSAKSAFADFSKAAADSKTSRKDLRDSRKAFEEATDPQTLIKNIQAQAAAVRDFTTNVAKLFASGNTRAAQEALKLGPEAGAAYAKSLVDGGPKIEAGVNQALLGADKANADYLNRVQTQWGPALVGAMGQIGTDASGAVTFGLSDPTQSIAVLNSNLSQVLATFGARSPEFATAAQLLGLSVSDALKTQLDSVPGNTGAQLGVAVSLIQQYVPLASTNAAAIAAAISGQYIGGLSNLTPATATALTNTANAIIAAQPTLSAATAATALNMADQFGNAITGGNGIPARGTNAYVQLEGDIRRQIPGLSLAAADAAIAQARAFEAHKDDIPKAADLGLNAMTGHLRDSASSLTAAGNAAGTAVTTGVKSGIESGTPQATSAATTSGQAVGTAYTQSASLSIAASSGQIGTAESAAVSTLGGAGTAAQAASAGNEIGAAFDSGIAAGVAEHSSTVQSAARQVIRDAESAAKNQAGIQSPSKLFAKIGGYLTEGLGVGIDGKVGAVVRSSKGAIQTIADSVTADVRKAAAKAQEEADDAAKRAKATGSEADRTAADRAAEEARRTKAQADAAYTAAENAARAVEARAAEMLKNVAQGVEATLVKSVDAAKIRATQTVTSGAAQIVKTLAGAVTNIGAGARAGLTTGDLSLTDVVAPVANQIQGIIDRENETLIGGLDRIQSATTSRLDSMTAKSTATLDRLVNGPSKTKDVAAAVKTPSAVVAATPITTASFAQALAGAAPVTTSLRIDVHLDGGARASEAVRIGNVIGNAAADTLARRGITAEVTAG